MCKALSSQCLSKATFLSKGRQLIVYLLMEHHDQAVAEHKHAVSHDDGIVREQPRIELMFLLKDMNAALMKHIILIYRFVKSDTCHLHIFRRVYRPRYLLML